MYRLYSMFPRQNIRIIVITLLSLTSEADSQYNHLNTRREAEQEPDVLLEHAPFRQDQSHGQNNLVQSIKVGQVLPVQVVPHVEGVVYGEPGPADLRHEAHTAVTL